MPAPKGTIVPMEMGKECDVCVRFDLSDPYVTLEKLFAIEKSLLEMGGYFDKGAGCGGRYWELDFSRRGSIEVFFKGDREKNTAEYADSDQFDLRSRRVSFNAVLCGVSECSPYTYNAACAVCTRIEFKKALGDSLFTAMMEFAEQKAHKDDCEAPSCSFCYKVCCTHLADLFQSLLGALLKVKKLQRFHDTVLEEQGDEGESGQEETKPHS